MLIYAMPRTLLFTQIALELIGSLGGLVLAFYGSVAGNQFWAAITLLAAFGLAIRLGTHLAQVL